MTKEEKQLLLKDLCGRLPYGVHILYDNTEVREMGLGSLHDFMFDSAEVKPYLRPMSSMTEEEKAIYTNYKIVVRGLGIMFEYNLDFVTEWLLKHHFDYRGLIEKGLALEAPEGMCVIKND